MENIYSYTHGGNVHSFDYIDFSASINPLGMPEEAVKAAQEAIYSSNIYPDSLCGNLTAKIAEFENVDRTCIFCSNGASDILFRLMFALKPEKVLVTSPSFADYERAGKAVGAKITYHSLNEADGFMIGDSFADKIISASPDAVFFCNPNNPTGTLAGMDITEKILHACKKVNAIFIADECFLDFVTGGDKYSVKQILYKYENSIILKAFTKIFAMPGLRLGYAICANRRLPSSLRFHGPDWPVSNIAQAAGIAALENVNRFIENTAAYIKNEREYFIKEFTDMGLKVFKTAANFIFFWCDPKNNLYNRLYEKKIIIRDCSNFKGLSPGYYRAAVLDREKNTKLVNALGLLL